MVAGLAAGWFGPSGRGDTVWVVQPDGSTQTRRGEIIDYRGDFLTLRRTAATTERIRSERIERIEANYGTRHRQAEAAFSEHRYGEARRLFLHAMEGESREWVQRLELARVIQCDWNGGRDLQAARQFLILVRNDPTVLHLEVAPLHWTARPLTASMRQWAEEHLGDETFAVSRLIAASWLLAGDRRQDAMEQLRELTSNGDSRIAFLARAQQWRTRWPALPDPPLREASESLSSVSEPLRRGGCFLIAEAHARAGDDRQATLWWLRVGLLYPHDARLAAAALWRAGDQLQRGGDSVAARRLFFELVQRYPASTEAGRARKRIESGEVNPKTRKE